MATCRDIDGKSVTILKEAIIENVGPESEGEVINEELIRNLYLDDHLPETKNDTATILLLGETGCGKSSLINSLLGEDVAKVSHGAESTKHEPIEEHTGNIGKMRLTLIDTRGLSDVDPELNEKQLINEFTQIIREKVDVVFICHPFFSRENKGLQQTLKLLATCFGSRSSIWEKCIIVLTQANLYKEKYYKVKKEKIAELMVETMTELALKIKECLVECGTSEDTIRRLPVCVTARDDDQELPITNNWISLLLCVCDSIKATNCLAPNSSKKFNFLEWAKERTIYTIDWLIGANKKKQQFK